MRDRDTDGHGHKGTDRQTAPERGDEKEKCTGRAENMQATTTGDSTCGWL